MSAFGAANGSILTGARSIMAAVSVHMQGVVTCSVPNLKSPK